MPDGVKTTYEGFLRKVKTAGKRLAYCGSGPAGGGDNLVPRALFPAPKAREKRPGDEVGGGETLARRDTFVSGI